MNIDFDSAYRAIESRDSRFDGQFFTAVTSTGIYCRPICPAQTPQRRNVRFYPTAAAAEAAGFRACKRCRPESAPDSPEWNVRDDLTARALRSIAEGTIDEEGVDGLARRLHVSARHLHRELTDSVGAGPLQLARTRRAQVARLLIDSTDMPLGEIAFAAGFRSIRQFNDTMRDSFGCPPSDLRRRQGTDIPGSGRIALRLPYHEPLHRETLLAYLSGRAMPGVEEVVGDRYRRTVRLSRGAGIIDLSLPCGASYALLRLRLDDPRDLAPLVRRCRRLLDLDADPAAIAAVLQASPILAPLVARYPGLRVTGSMDGWETAARTILGQQVSVAGARTLASRLARTLGTPLPDPDGELTHLFPGPEAVAEGDLSILKLNRQRENALRRLAQAAVNREVVLDDSGDREETEAQLLALPGVGPWTASYIAMRVLRDPDAFPAGDLGLRRAFERLGLPGDRRSIEETSEAWRPWRAYAVMYLWKSLEEPQ